LLTPQYVSFVFQHSKLFDHYAFFRTTTPNTSFDDPHITVFFIVTPRTLLLSRYEYRQDNRKIHLWRNSAKSSGKYEIIGKVDIFFLDNLSRQLTPIQMFPQHSNSRSDSNGVHRRRPKRTKRYSFIVRVRPFEIFAPKSGPRENARAIWSAARIRL